MELFNTEGITFTQLSVTFQSLEFPLVLPSSCSFASALFLNLVSCYSLLLTTQKLSIYKLSHLQHIVTSASFHIHYSFIYCVFARTDFHLSLLNSIILSSQVTNVNLMFSFTSSPPTISRAGQRSD